MAKQDGRHSEPLAGEKSVDLGRRLCRLHTFSFSLFYLCVICKICGSICFYKNEPNFFAANYGFLHQKRRNRGQKVRQKNETNPIVDNFACTLNANHFFRSHGPALSAVSLSNRARRNPDRRRPSGHAKNPFSFCSFSTN
jgi:hypothetical protein